LGHGKSAPEAGQRGFFAEKDGRLRILEDMHQLFLLGKEAYPKVPHFLMGHSMGSFLSRLYCARYRDDFDGAIFMGTAGPNPMAGMGLSLARLINAFKGKRGVSKLITNLIASQNNYPDSRTAFDWLNSDPREVDIYMADKDCGFPFTNSAYCELLQMMMDINKAATPAAYRQDLPILLISGEADTVGAMGRGVRQVHELFKAQGLSQVELKLYPGLRHEILKEPSREAVYADIHRWLVGQVGK
jgi:alpha-beta hydrolase superfamily lysophospholipase